MAFQREARGLLGQNRRVGGILTLSSGLSPFLGNGTLNKLAGIDFRQLSLGHKLNENQSGEVLLPAPLPCPPPVQMGRGPPFLALPGALTPPLPCSSGRGAGRGTTLSSRSSRSATGQPGRAGTSTRSTPSSGEQGWGGLCPAPSAAPGPVFGGVKADLSLSQQDFLPPKCAASAGCLPVAPRSAPHHHHPLDALRLPLQCTARRH